MGGPEFLLNEQGESFTPEPVMPLQTAFGPILVGHHNTHIEDFEPNPHVRFIEHTRFDGDGCEEQLTLIPDELEEDGMHRLEAFKIPRIMTYARPTDEDLAFFNERFREQYEIGDPVPPDLDDEAGKLLADRGTEHTGSLLERVGNVGMVGLCGVLLGAMVIGQRALRLGSRHGEHYEDGTAREKISPRQNSVTNGTDKRRTQNKQGIRKS